MKEKLNIELNQDLWIFVEGNYTKPESETGYSGEFDIIYMEITKGTLLNLIDWFENKNPYGLNLRFGIETLCIKKLE